MAVNPIDNEFVAFVKPTLIEFAEKCQQYGIPYIISMVINDEKGILRQLTLSGGDMPNSMKDAATELSHMLPRLMDHVIVEVKQPEHQS